jgi:hypothetical protein
VPDRLAHPAGPTSHGELTDRYALNPDGAVLVRPDGYLAWRT